MALWRVFYYFLLAQLKRERKTHIAGQWVIFITEIPARFMTLPDFCPDYSRFPATLFIRILYFFYTFYILFLIALFSGNRLSVDFSLCAAQRNIKMNLVDEIFIAGNPIWHIYDVVRYGMVWGYRSNFRVLDIVLGTEWNPSIHCAH